MAYIAPSLWAVNEYGEGLRQLLRERQQLDRWIDFKSFQVFSDVTTYTALQFFTHDPQNSALISAAPEGEIEDVDWSDTRLAVPYADLPDDGEWLMATGAERALINRLDASCLKLENPLLTRGIIVGIQTSADKIYHLERVAERQYRCTPRGAAPYIVEIEDAVMKPLISGPEAKRYEDPETDTYLLFPYVRSARGNMELISEDEMARQYPRAWAYLRTWEGELRGRERGKMDGPSWWAYNYPKNLDKQDHIKLLVPRLVEHLKASLDVHGEAYLDNVDVGGVLPAAGIDPAFLLGVMNGPVADFVFRRIAKPFRGGFRSANKQFIAPLPVPDASTDEKDEIAGMAIALQEGWTNRRRLLTQAEERLSVLARARHGEHWIWPDLPAMHELEAAAPQSFAMANERRDWAKQRIDEAVAERLEKLQAALDADVVLEVAFRDGELVLHAGGRHLLDRIYLDEAMGRLVEEYWRFLLLSQPWRDASGFAEALRRPPAEPASPAARQFVERVQELAVQVADIAEQEAALNERLFALYDLTEAERFLVETDDRGRR